jgi:hypothetical protein
MLLLMHLLWPQLLLLLQLLQLVLQLLKLWLRLSQFQMFRRWLSSLEGGGFELLQDQLGWMRQQVLVLLLKLFDLLLDKLVLLEINGGAGLGHLTELFLNPLEAFQELL